MGKPRWPCAEGIVQMIAKFTDVVEPHCTSSWRDRDLWLVRQQIFVEGYRTSLAERLGELNEARDRQVLKVDVWFSAAWAPWSQCGAILLRHVASGQSAEATILDHSRHLDVHTPIPIASYTKLARCPRGTWRAIDPFAANRYCTLTYSRG